MFARACSGIRLTEPSHGRMRGFYYLFLFWMKVDLRVALEWIGKVSIGIRTVDIGN